MDNGFTLAYSDGDMLDSLSIQESRGRELFDNCKEFVDKVDKDRDDEDGVKYFAILAHIKFITDNANEEILCAAIIFRELGHVEGHRCERESNDDMKKAIGQLVKQLDKKSFSRSPDDPAVKN